MRIFLKNFRFASIAQGSFTEGVCNFFESKENNLEKMQPRTQKMWNKRLPMIESS